MRVFISGPMRGYPDFNRSAFYAAEHALIDKGHMTFNPARYDEEEFGQDFLLSESGDLAQAEAKGFDLKATMAVDLEKVVLWADMVCVLPEWFNSLGAQAEVAAARAVGKPVSYVDDIPEGDEPWLYIDAQDRDAERIFGSIATAADDETICQEADRLVSTDRQDSYGRPIDNFTQTGRMWAAILDLDEVTAEQVGLCMIAVKLSRATHAPKRDTLVDIAGYAKTLDMIAQDREARR